MATLNEQRNKKGLYTMTNVAEMLGLTLSAVFYHVNAGHFPEPQSGIGKRKFYTPEDVKRIKEIWGVL